MSRRCHATLALSVCSGLLAATSAASYGQAPQGYYTTVTGFEEFNLTYLQLADAERTATLSGGPPYCGSLKGVPAPNVYYGAPTNNGSGYESALPAYDATDGLALLQVNVSAGSVAFVTFYGGDITSAVPGIAPSYKPPFVTTVDNSTDTGSASGPLYVTKAPLYQNPSNGFIQYELDLAEFAPTFAGQAGWIHGGLTTIGAAEECYYNITFFSV